MAITDWPAEERPRERLLAHGAEALSDAELLAIFLRVGMRGMSAVDLGRSLLRHFGGLAPLFHAPLNEFSRIPGMGTAKFTQLQAVLEMARRAIGEEMQARHCLNSPEAVRSYLRLAMSGLEHEVFFALWLDAQNRLIVGEPIARGTLTQATVFPREVIKRALAVNAAAVIIAHNHPSGIAEASTADIHLTKALKETLALIDVRLLDHFIVATGASPLSLCERGYC